MEDLGESSPAEINPKLIRQLFKIRKNQNASRSAFKNGFPKTASSRRVDFARNCRRWDFFWLNVSPSVLAEIDLKLIRELI